MSEEWEAYTRLHFGNLRQSHKDQALFFIENERDFEAQLYAIKGALERNKEAESKSAEAIKQMRGQIESLDPEDHGNAWHLTDYLNEMFHESVYADAAHSMAAVGMLAPYFESLFVALFEAIRRESLGHGDQGGRAKAFQDLYWNPQVVVRSNEKSTDLVRGIKELAAEVGLLSYLPHDYEKTLSALFAYRNNMFHNGFEWPLEVRQRFQARIKSRDWPDGWFKQSTQGNDPWIFYMSEGFIQHCLRMIDDVLGGVGKFLAERPAQ